MPRKGTRAIAAAGAAFQTLRFPLIDSLRRLAAVHCNAVSTNARRTIEDIPEEIEPVVTEHTIHRDYCPNCQKHVEPVVPDAMPKATLGHRLIALTSWFHYGLGLTIDQIVDILGYHPQTKLTAGGLIDAWRRQAEVLEGWYQQIGEQARSSAHLHADAEGDREGSLKGWRVSGQTRCLWCFANGQVCYYMIDRSRGSPALQKFFTDLFEGVLITDFWSAYESVCAEDRQYGLVHLLRELEKVDEGNDSSEWQAFAKNYADCCAMGFGCASARTSRPKPIAVADALAGYAITHQARDPRLKTLSENPPQSPLERGEVGWGRRRCRSDR
ncbi:MAG: transposase [Planctomycetes bacterium]|nr:transposase [Planctomycetota bacterium]